jgi:hypothetical protein
MNTVAGNEALVLDGAAAWRPRGAAAFGLNPGLIRTGIRDNYLGGGALSAVVEPLIGAFNPTPDAYAAAIVPLLFAPGLEAHSGAHFDQAADAIHRSPGLTPAHVAALLAESEALAERALKAPAKGP